MNKHTLEGNWQKTKGKIKEQWGRLTDDEIDEINGQAEQLAGAIRKHYGRTLDEARREVELWRRRASE